MTNLKGAAKMAKKKKPVEVVPPKFVLELSELQAEVLIKALDLYSRIGIGQIGEVHNILTLEPHIKSPSENTYQGIKNALDFVKRELFGFEAGASFAMHAPQVPDKFKVAWDLQQVIRHKLAWTANPAGGVGVSFQEPMKSSKEPLATMTEADAFHALLEALRQSIEGKT